MKKFNGFTMIELMITLLIAGIIMGIAVPSMSTLIQNNRQVSRNNELIGLIGYARSEAVSLNLIVSICASSDGSTCNTTNWEEGAFVFRGDEEGSLAGVSPAADDILKIMRPQSAGTTLRRRPNSNAVPAGFNAGYLRFGRGGRLMESDAGSFVLCDSRGAPSAKGINLNVMGQARSATDADQDGIVELVFDDALQAITCP